MGLDRNVSILDFIGAAKDNGGGDVNWSSKMCKAPVNRHIQHSIQLFTRRMPFLLPNQQHESTELRYGAQMLKNVNQERDIGVQLAADFKPSRQCQLAYSRANELLV